MERNNDNSIDNDEIVVEDEVKWNNVTPENFVEWETIEDAFKENLGVEFSAACLIEDIKNKDPIDIFSMIFSDELFGSIAYNSNLYYYQYSQNNYISDSSEYARWKDIDANICKAFVGILLLMGLNYRCNMNDHWSTDKLLKSIISEIIPRQKFWLIWSFLHLSDNRNEITPMDKVKGFVDYLERKWQLFYSCGQSITIDETMMDYQGITRYKQYAPRKPTKWGIKAFCMADAKNGYMIKFRPYEGKDKSKEKVSEKIVRTLCEDMEEKSFTFYLDSYFSSPYLFSLLQKAGYDCVGTLNLNRKGITNSMRDNDLDNNNKIKIYESNNMMLMKFKDRKSFSILSTIKEMSLVSDEVYDKKNKKLIEIKKPTIVMNYSKYMRGVDLNNQLCSYYKFDNKVHKWWKVVFMHVIQITVTNSYIIYNTFGKKDLNHKEFLLSIIHSLLEKHKFMNQKKIDIDLNKFFIKKTRQVCKDCKLQKIKTLTRRFCTICDKAICKDCGYQHISVHYDMI